MEVESSSEPSGKNFSQEVKLTPLDVESKMGMSQIPAKDYSWYPKQKLSILR
jgi:hypothetical protein